MSKMSFTKEQQQVIDLRHCNMLVSAAAGSGKTAVITERILSLLCDKEEPADIDRMLIVTFTTAAAEEMRERINKTILSRLADEPENGHLVRQEALLQNARITTIDSFCLYVVKNHFSAIGLDPGFRTVDDGEKKLMQKEVLDELGLGVVVLAEIGRGVLLLDEVGLHIVLDGFLVRLVLDADDGFVGVLEGVVLVKVAGSECAEHDGAGSQ